jgi:hypothetical protein
VHLLLELEVHQLQFALELELLLRHRHFGLRLAVLRGDISLRLNLLDLCLALVRLLVDLGVSHDLLPAHLKFLVLHLRISLHLEQGRIRLGRRRRELRLAGLRVFRARVVDELIRVLMPHQLGNGSNAVEQLGIVNQVGLAAKDKLLLDVQQRHCLRELLSLAAITQDQHEWSGRRGSSSSRVNLHPVVAQANRLGL